MSDKPVEITLEYCRTTNVISVSFDDSTTYNIHFVEGFERAFDRLTDILSQKMNVAVKKTRFHLEDGPGDQESYYLRSKEKS